MRIIDKIPSREPCAEAGWYAWDYLLDRPADDDFILSLRPLGAFTYLRALKKPFYKIESEYLHIRGMKGDDYVRVAANDGHREALAAIETLVNGENAQ